MYKKEIYTIYPFQSLGCTKGIKSQTLDIQEQEQYYQVIDYKRLLKKKNNKNLQLASNSVMKD